MAPKSIDILGKKYSLKIIKNLKDDEDNPLCGCVVWKSNSIYLNANLSPEDKLSTLLHEMIHVILNRTGVTQTLPHCMDEVVSESCANQLTDFILKNWENLFE